MEASKIEYINRFKMDKSVNFEYLRALSNLIKEYKPLNYSTEDILEIWYEYIWKIYRQNIIREKPLLFKGFKSIQGEQNIMECAKQSGVFVSFHLNSYRFVPFSLANYLKNNGMPYKLSLLMDKKTNELEQKLDEYAIKNDLFHQVLISDDIAIGYKIIKAMKDSFLFLYLDGNTGIGNDLDPIELNHLSSTVTIRSGIFRLLSIIDKPICCIISVTDEEGNEHLVAHDLIRVNNQNYEKSASKIYRSFIEVLINGPENWQFWCRHHRQVKSWKKIHVTNNVKLDYFDKEKQFGLSLQDGNFYRVGDAEKDGLANKKLIDL